MKLNAIHASAAPVASGGYSQALEVCGAQRLLFISGQIPETRAGSVPEDFKSQAELVWAHVRARLEAANMTIANLVKVTTFLSSREFAIPNREVREAVLGNHAPALTVLITGIFDEQWLIEIEAVAAA